MGLFVDLHTELMGLLAEIKAAAGTLRVYDDPPVQLPEMPCVFLLTPDESFDRLDTMTGEYSTTTIIRLCVDQRYPQTTLLGLADTICEVTDGWVWNEPVAPIDRGRRTGMRSVTPVFNEVPVRGLDFPVEIQMTRPIQPG